MRGEVYAEQLHDLTDEQWHYAVRQAIETLDWFPTVRQLRDLAEGPGAPKLAGYLPPHRPSEEEREAARAESRRLTLQGLELCKEAYRRVAGLEPGQAVQDMP